MRADLALSLTGCQARIQRLYNNDLLLSIPSKFTLKNLVHETGLDTGQSVQVDTQSYFLAALLRENATSAVAIQVHVDLSLPEPLWCIHQPHFQKTLVPFQTMDN